MKITPRGRDASTRDNLVGRVVAIHEWIATRQVSFSKHDLAAGIGFGHRSAHRYLLAFEASGLVDCDRAGQRWLWRRVTKASA